MSLKELQNMGIHVVMLTGDNKRTANAIGGKVGVDEVIAGVLPDGKENVIRKLKEQGKEVIGVGKINDIFAKGNNFGKTFDTTHDGSITSKKGFGGYYYLYNGTVYITNGGGFDHLWRCNMLTNRAWQSATSKWYLYGARLIYKNIDNI